MTTRCSACLPAILFGVVLGLSAAAARAQTATPPPPPSGTVAATVPTLGTPMSVRQIFAHVLVDQFELRTAGPGSALRWDGEAWIGTDMNKLWLKSEGVLRQGAVSDGDQEALYDRPIPHLRYFDAQVGVRADLDSGPHRTWAALGVEGLAPYYFRFAPTLYIGAGGRLAGRVSGSYDMYLTQRLIAEPEAEFNFYSRDDPARRLGAGLANADMGVRLRYEISRKLAPYVGFAYAGRFGKTAAFSRQAGEPVRNRQLIVGFRFWY